MDDRTKSVMDDTRAAREDVRETVTPQTEEIRSQIEQTRDDLSETIDAIQEKLRPGHLVSEATDRVRTATRTKVKQMAYSASDRAERVADAGRQNWIPAALIGVGTAWLLMNRSGARSRGYDSDDVYGVADYVRDEAYRPIGTRGSVSSSSEPRTYDEAKGAVSGLAGRVSDRASTVMDETRDTVRRTTARAQNQLQRMIDENPLMVGAAAIALGAAVGLALPETERENEWMGESRENVVERAQDVARGAVDKVKDAASKTVGDAITGNIKE
jgi:ElaB/YqjD/DUF883 family membrane-anchored ribosome-binding protein